MAIKVLIADDHAVVRQGLRIFLGLDPEIEIVGEATDGAQACALSAELRPDVVLMDLIMPGMDGVTATAIIRRELPETEVIALTAALEDRSVDSALQAGAIGFLLKDADGLELRQSIKSAAAGQLVLSPKVAARLMRDLEPPATGIDLTEREKEVLSLMARGSSNKEIAQRLYISAPTVKSHVTSILAKFNVSSRTQAVLYALRMGLVTLNGEQQRSPER